MTSKIVVNKDEFKSEYISMLRIRKFNLHFVYINTNIKI